MLKQKTRARDALGKNPYSDLKPGLEIHREINLKLRLLARR